MPRSDARPTGNPASAKPLNSHCDMGPQPDARQPPRRIAEGRSQIFGMTRNSRSRQILPASPTMHTDVSLTETSSPPQYFMLRFFI
jgi:hypothetical protein